ncbi:MAG: hypothetical protein L3K08_07455 [Thermoplasmata archaeon]|nr:hypothetical protein [Thermoplasmata archaeon]
MAAFWREALHSVPRDPPRPDRVILTDPTGRGPNLNLSATTEAPLREYRLHLDLYAPTARRGGLSQTRGPRPCA